MILMLKDWLLLVGLFIAAVYVVCFVWYIVAEEREYRRWKKRNG